MSKVIIAKSLEGASMILTFSWILLFNDLCAVPWLIVISLTFLSEHMPNVVSIVLFEFVSIYSFLGELLFPELHRFINSEPDTLQEKSELKSAEMLQVVLVSQGSEQPLHAWWETLSLVVIEV